MSENDKLILLVGVMATGPIALMAAVEPEKLALFGRIFVAVLRGMFGV